MSTPDSERVERARSRRVVVFDFDGTLTKFDSLLPFLRFYAGRAAFFGNSIRMTPAAVFFALGRISNHDFKERVLRLFLQGVTEASLKDACRRFVQDVMPAIINPVAMRQLERHREQSDRIYIVSASPEAYLQPWAEHHNLDGALGTRLVIENGRVAGAIDGRNCHGQEKVRRLRAHIPELFRDNLVVYGDSRGDEALYQVSGEYHHRRFSNPLWSWSSLRRVMTMLRLLA